MTKKRLMKMPSKETKQLVKKVTRVPKVKGKTGKHSHNDENSDENMSDVQSERSQARSTTSTSSHRSKLDSWLGKSSQYMHLKDEHCSPSSRKSISSARHSKSEDNTRIDHFGRRDEEMRHNYINNMMKDQDSMLETRRVKTDNGAWKTEVSKTSLHRIK